MSTPREAVRLVRSPDGELRMVGNRTGEDWTERIRGYSEETVTDLEPRRPAGFILKKGSPSCGLFRVRRYDAAGNRLPSDGPGLFAARVREMFGALPIEEEGRLNDPGLRHQFLMRLFAAHRVDQLRLDGVRRADVMEFHRKEKLLLMAHSPSKQKELGRLIATASGSTADLVGPYRDLFLRALSEKAHRGRLVNVFQHMAGYLREHLDGDDSRELENEILGFQGGVRHSSAIWMLLRHHLRRHEVEYLLDQTVSDPYPAHLLDSNPDPHVPPSRS